MSSPKRSVLAACAALAIGLGAAPARAGEILLELGSGPFTAMVHEPHTGHWAGAGGSIRLRVQAFRATPSASYGSIVGGALVTANVLASPTHQGGGLTRWTVGRGIVSPSASAAPLPSIYGSFFGVNDEGTAVNTLFFQNAPIYAVPPTSNATVGQTNPYSGALRPGFLRVFGFASLYGYAGPYANGGACFNDQAGNGPCATVTGAVVVDSASNPAAGSVPGFNIGGLEVSRSVAIEPLPEPARALALGAGALASIALAGRARRRVSASG